MKSNCYIFSISLSLMYSLGYAQSLPSTADGAASAETYQPPITVVNDVTAYHVNDDYSYTHTQTRTIRLNSSAGVKQFSQIPLSYNPELEKLDVVEAYTTKADGKKIDVDPSAILDRQSSASADAPMFNSDRVKTVIFPDTAVGDELTVVIKEEGKPLFPGSFSSSDMTPPIFNIEHSEITVSVPKGMKLYTDAISMKGGEAQQKDGRQEWTWTLENKAGVAPEPGMAITMDNVAGVFTTTFANEQEAATAYLSRAQDKAKVSDAVQKQADAITKGISDKKEQAKAIYNWVSENIRYVAVYFGAGGVVPHSADEILNNRYGDCKDHVAILEALLAAKGIKSEPVLVNAGGFYGVPKVASMPGIFNHAISYLPDYDLYVDSTAEVATFGVLPATELGKPALRSSEKHAALVTLPLSAPKTNTLNSEIDVTLKTDGTATGHAKITQSGQYDLIARQIASSIPKGLEPQLAQKILQINGLSGSGNYQFEGARKLSKPFAYQSEFELRNVFDEDSEEGAFRLPLGIGGLGGINDQTFHGLASLPERKLPFVVIGGALKSTIHYNLPANLKVSKLPKDMNVDNELGSYQTHYEQDGQQITVTRQLTIKKKEPVTSIAEYPAYQALNDAVSKDLRRQVFYSIEAAKAERP